MYIYNVTNWRKPSKPCVQGVSLGLGLFRSGSGGQRRGRGEAKGITLKIHVQSKPR